MPLRDHLLAERERVLNELEAVEALLLARCGWTPPKRPTVPKEDLPPPPKADLGSAVSLSGGNASKPAKPLNDFDDEGLPYMELAHEFVESWKSPQFGQADFRAFVAAKHGEDKINEQSIRGPLPKLVKKGLITVIRPSIGKRPVIYGKPLDENPDLL